MRDSLIPVVSDRSHINTPDKSFIIHLYRYIPDGLFYGKLSDGTSVPIGGGVMDTIWERGAGPNSAVLISQGDTNQAGGDFAVTYGVNSRALARYSRASGELCETGLIPNDFTCVAGSNTLTIPGINVVANYTTGQSYRILYFDSNGEPAYKDIIVNSSGFNGTDTVITFSPIIDLVTTSGEIYNYRVGDNSDASGYKAKSRGNHSYSQGYDVQASAQDSQSRGTFTRAKAVRSKADGSYAVANNYGESARGFGNYTDAADPDDVIGQNMRRELGIYALHNDINPQELFLDGTVNTISLPDNSICLLYVDLVSMQIDDALPNFGDCLIMQWRFGVKVINGVVTQVGGGGNVLPAAGLTKFDGVGNTWTPTMSLSTNSKFRFFLAAQPGVRSQIVVWAKQIAKLD